MRYLHFIFFIFLFFSVEFLVAQEFEDFKAFSSGKGKITSVTYSADGKLFAAGNEYGLILLRNSTTSDITHILRGHTEAINQISFHPNSQLMSSCSEDGTVKIWDLSKSEASFDSHNILKDFKTPDNFTFSQFSRDGSIIYYGGSDGKIYAVNIVKGGSLDILAESSDRLTCGLQLKKRNQLIVGGSASIKIYDTKSQKLIKVLKGCGMGHTVALKTTPDEKELAALCMDGTLCIWNLETGMFVKTIRVSTSSNKNDFAYSPDGQYLVAGDSDGEPQVFSVPDYEETCKLTGHRAAVSSVTFSPDSKFIITGGADQMIKMWRWKKVFENEDIPEQQLLEALPSSVTDNVVIPEEPKSLFDRLELKYTHRSIPDSLGDRKVKTGKRVMIESESIEIAVWDSEYEDGDTISLFLNGEWLLKEYPLRSKKKKVKLVINKNSDNYLILYAHNEGTRPPNTAAVTINDGVREKKMSLSSDMKTSDAVNFVFKD